MIKDIRDKKLKDKIRLVQSLERKNILQEDCPRPRCWNFTVLQPDKLPEELKEEYEQHKEIRIIF